MYWMEVSNNLSEDRKALLEKVTSPRRILKGGINCFQLVQNAICGGVEEISKEVVEVVGTKRKGRKGRKESCGSFERECRYG
jgi:hypothetical protein